MAKRIVPVPMPKAQQLHDAVLLGQFVRAARTGAGLSLEDAAAFCGVGKSTLEKIERATGDVQLSGILAVCSMLGIVITIGAKGEMDG